MNRTARAVRTGARKSTMIRSANRLSMSLGAVLLIALYSAVAESAVAESAEEALDYTPAQIELLINSGRAKRHGAAFANQGLGCTTYLYKESDEHHLFVFRRDGRSYGEFRDERLAEGRYLSTVEKYLVAESRQVKDRTSGERLRYVCKQTIPVWQDGVVLSSNVRWSFLSTDADGSNPTREAITTKRMVRGVAAILVPGVYTPDAYGPKGENYFVALQRKNRTEHEIAFGQVRTVFQDSGFINGRCCIWTEWPDDDPVFHLVLSKRVKPSKRSSNLEGEILEGETIALPFIRKESVGTMEVRLDRQTNAPIVYTPD